ncbi:DUF3576 domain-containing protein [Pelagibacteraceae bacterium]|nr:DUF3576 domain-containing protein [Pelagibacteraceae bacterium]
MFLNRLIFSFLLLFIFSCNSNKSEEEMEELWSKAQTTGEIINRSGTVFNPGINKDLALRDAQTRLQSGGGLFGKGGLSLGGIVGGNNKQQNTSAGMISMSVNPFLWRAALETIDFMPLSSADQIGGTIITDWYSTSGNEKERCKLNIFITGINLKTDNLRVVSFCQEFKNPTWVNKETEKENNIKIENAILNKAKKLKLQSS